MKKIRVLALLLSLCLLLTSTACQSEQDALYSEAVSKQEGQSVAEPSVDPNDPGYLGEPTPEPGTVFTPVPNDDLIGELTIKCYPLLRTEGKLGIRTVDGFAMPSSLKNKELAWEFIKYCLSAREDPSVYELTGFRWLCSEGFYLNTTITDVLRQS